jgi:hypothetical protein
MQALELFSREIQTIGLQLEVPANAGDVANDVVDTRIQDWLAARQVEVLTPHRYGLVDHRPPHVERQFRVRRAAGVHRTMRAGEIAPVRDVQIDLADAAGAHGFAHA